MITMELDLMEDLTDELTKRLEELSGREVEVGMFAEQGKHYSGFSYVGLFKYLSSGDPSRGLPARNALFVTSQLHPLSRSPLKSDLRSFLSDLSSKGGKTSDKVLKGLGEHYRERVRDVFGDDTLLDPKAASTKENSASPNTPLIEKGSLAKKVAYKIDQQPPSEIGL